MSIVLFHIKSGAKIGEFKTDQEARDEMNMVNQTAGWEKLNSSWSDGIEKQWAVHKSGIKDYAPYGITEFERWRKYIPHINRLAG